VGAKTIFITDVTSSIGLAMAILLTRSGHREYGGAPERTGNRAGRRPAVRKRRPRRALYERHPVPGVTQPGTIQWLNPDAFVSAVDPSTGACYGADSPQNCQFGNLARNGLRGPDFVWNDFYLTKWFSLTEQLKMRFDAQFFNVFNHPNFGLPSRVLAGVQANLNARKQSRTSTG
jgi:hypothetical protein